MKSMKVYIIKKYDSKPNEIVCREEVVKVCLTEDDAKDILHQTGARYDYATYERKFDLLKGLILTNSDHEVRFTISEAILVYNGD